MLRFYTKFCWLYYTLSLNEEQPLIKNDWFLLWKLTEEQSFMADKIKNNRSGIIHMGTGRGKSWVIYDTVCKKWVSSLILCHNIQTADTMYEGFCQNTNIPKKDIALLHSKSKHKEPALITITTHAGFVKNWEQYVNMFNLICYDECDYNLSFPQWYDYNCMYGALVLANPTYLYGFTGTPYRAEWGAEVLERIFGDIWTREKAEYNFIPEVKQIDYKYHWSYVAENFQELLHNLATDEDRTQAQVKTYNENKRKRNLILVKTVEESYKFNDLIPNSILLNGQMPKMALDLEMERLFNSINADSGFTIVGTIDKMWRGVDIPPIDTIFLFSPVKFKGTVVQAVWRGLRKYPNKTNVLIYDWCDLPLLKKQKNERREAYKQEYGITI